MILNRLLLYPRDIIHAAKKIVVCFERGFPLRAMFFNDINLERMPKSTVFGHPFGIVIRHDTTVGEGCTFRQNVTIGQRRTESGGAVIGNNVSFGAGSIVLGDIVINDNVVIGAGAIVLKDVPEGTTVTGLWK